jgi:hypothetical protein
MTFGRSISRLPSSRRRRKGKTPCERENGLDRKWKTTTK